MSKYMYMAFACVLSASLILLDSYPQMAIPEFSFWGLVLLCFLGEVSAVPVFQLSLPRPAVGMVSLTCCCWKERSPDTTTSPFGISRHILALAWLCSRYVSIAQCILCRTGCHLGEQRYWPRLSWTSGSHKPTSLPCCGWYFYAC